MKKYLLSFLTIILISQFSCSKNNNIQNELQNEEDPTNEDPLNYVWTQIGESIQSPHPEYFGWSLDLNNIGNKIIIGDISENTGPTGCNGSIIDCNGNAIVYEYNGNNWNQYNEVLYGEIAIDRFGYDVKIDGDGNHIFILEYSYDTNDYVRVKTYSDNGGIWTQTNLPTPEYIQPGLDYETRISANDAGDIFAFSTPSSFDSSAYIYKKNSQGWEQIAIIPSGNQGYTGYVFLSLNSSGDKIAIGNPKKNYVRVYENIGGQWLQIGNDISGVYNQVFPGVFGDYLELNNEGDTLIVGAIESNTKVFTYNGSQWVQKGQDILVLGEDVQNLVSHPNDIAINGDGDRIAVNYRNIAPSPPYSKEEYVITYQYETESDQWVQIGDKIDINIYTRIEIDFNDDGTILAIGLPGLENNWGSVNIYQLEEID